MPQTPSGGGSMAPPILPLPSVRMSTKALRSTLSAAARSRSGIVERRGLAVEHDIAIDVRRQQLANRLGRLGFHVLQHRDLQKIRGSKVELARAKGHHPGRNVLDDRILNAVDIRPALLPIIRVSRYFDRLLGFELGEFEGAGADRVRAYLARRHMTRVDRREPGGEQRNKGRLRALQLERDLVVAIGCDPL